MFLDLHEGILLEFAERSATSFDQDIKEGILRGVKPHDYAAENETKNTLRIGRKALGLCIQCGDPAAENTGTKNRGKRGTRCAECAAGRTVKKAA